MASNPPSDEAPPPPLYALYAPPVPMEPPVSSYASAYASSGFTAAVNNPFAGSGGGNGGGSGGGSGSGSGSDPSALSLYYSVPGPTLFPIAANPALFAAPSATNLLPSLDASLMPGHGFGLFPGAGPSPFPGPALSAALSQALGPAPANPLLLPVLPRAGGRRRRRPPPVPLPVPDAVDPMAFNSQDVPSVWLKPFCGEQTLESRYGRHARRIVYAALTDNQPNNGLQSMAAYVDSSPGSSDADVDMDGSDDGNAWVPPPPSPQPQPQPQSARPETGIPNVARARMNLTALSQEYNLYFAAYRDEIHVYRPQPPPEILADPLLVLNPPPSHAAGLFPNHHGSLDPRFPHQVNHVVVGDLGSLEILLLAYDDGDVVAYYTHEIARCAEARLHGAGGGGSRHHHRPASLLGPPRPFLHETVGETAWGLAVHAQSRLIAVSCNLCEVHVFAFALAPPRGRHPQLRTDFSRLTPPGLEMHLRRRDRDCRLLLPIGWTGNNMPSVAFASGADGTAEAVLAADIYGSLWALPLWTVAAFPLKLDPSVSEQGWGVLPIPTRDFLLTTLMPPPTEVHPRDHRDHPLVTPMDVSAQNVEWDERWRHIRGGVGGGGGGGGGGSGGVTAHDDEDGDADAEDGDDDDDDDMNDNNGNNDNNDNNDNNHDNDRNNNNEIDPDYDPDPDAASVVAPAVPDEEQLWAAMASGDDGNGHLATRWNQDEDTDGSSVGGDDEPFPLPVHITVCWKRAVEKSRLLTFPYRDRFHRPRRPAGATAAAMADDDGGGSGGGGGGGFQAGLVVCPSLAMAWCDLSPAGLLRVLQSSRTRRDATLETDALGLRHPAEHAHLRRVLRRYAFVRTYNTSVELVRLPPFDDAFVLAEDLLLPRARRRRVQPPPGSSTPSEAPSEVPSEAPVSPSQSPPQVPSPSQSQSPPPAPSPSPGGPPLPWDMGDNFVRGSLVHYVPALRLVIAGTPQGTVALLRPVRSYVRTTRYHPRHRFRVEWTLPRPHDAAAAAAAAGRYPRCCLLGLAVSPVPRPGHDGPLLRLAGGDDDDDDDDREYMSRQRQARLPFKAEARYWRLILHYMDHTVLQYYIESTKHNDARFRERFQKKPEKKG